MQLCTNFFLLLYTQKFQKLWEANDPTQGGSPYLRGKVESAKKVLEDQIRKGGSI